MISKIPFLTNIMAMAANRRLVTFDIAREPATPKILISLSEAENTKPANNILTIKDMAVVKIPHWPTIIRVVVRTAGPTIKGMPKGTTPRVLAGSRRFFSGLRISFMAITNNKIPPAIIKSAIVIPKNLKINLPIVTNRSAMIKAVITEDLMMRVFSLRDRPEASEIKIGKTPRASTATNMGIKDRKKIFNITLK